MIVRAVPRIDIGALFGELNVSGVLALSFTIAFASTIFPMSAVGTCHEKVLAVLETDANNWFARIVLVTELKTGKLYVYGDVPPITFAVNTSKLFGVTVGVLLADIVAEGFRFTTIDCGEEPTFSGTAESSVTTTL